MKNMLVISLILILFAACVSDSPSEPANQVLSVNTVQVPLATVTSYTSYPVNLEGTISSGVRAKVSGYITEVLADEGEVVKKGQPLFRLETASLTEQAEAAKANISAAQVEVDKLKPLVEKDIVSDIQLRTAEAKLAQAKANYGSIRADISYATIVSPVAGRVGSIPFREGTLVSPNDPEPLITVSKTENVFAFFSMNERAYLELINKTEGVTRADKIKNLPPVELVLVNNEVYQHKGIIQTISGQVNPSTGTVGFRAEFPNEEGVLLNGNSGILRIPKTYDDVPVIPETATFERQGLVYAYKIQGDTVTISTLLKIRDRVNNLIVVEEGLIAGDQIVASGLSKIRDLSLVSPVNVPFDSVAHSLEVVFK